MREKPQKHLSKSKSAVIRQTKKHCFRPFRHAPKKRKCLFESAEKIAIFML